MLGGIAEQAVPPQRFPQFDVTGGGPAPVRQSTSSGAPSGAAWSQFSEQDSAPSAPRGSRRAGRDAGRPDSH